MKKISLQAFKHTLRDIHKHTENRKFCFIIGAGASFKSGIPTGGQLANRWFDELTGRYDPNEIKDWIEATRLDKEDLAAHYGAIYRKRFESDKTSGYEFLVQAMRDAKPTFGHFVLAQILSKTQGNCVLTTNFDSLVESAIYQFTDKTPLVCGHESLSGYARPSNIHPLIIKIHRDLLLAPKSDIDEISQLDKGWVEPLNNIFSSHIPIVIGYGGNDGSLMAYFEAMNKPSNFFWCVHNQSTPSARVQNLVKNMEGSFIEINGFDEMMKELLWVFDEIKPVKEELDAVTRTRIESMTKQLEEMDAKTEKSNPVKLEKEKELSAFEYAAKAENEPDLEKRKAIYLEAVEKFPKTGWLLGTFASFLHSIKKDYNDVEKYYLKALASDPDDATTNGNYANFLKNIKKDYDNAEKHYLKALASDPDHANNNGNYANFLKNIRKDYDNAEKHYLKALASDLDHAAINGNHAVFLTDIKKDYDNAEKHYLKALANKPDDANINGNYANFLTHIKKDYNNAEKHYLKALAGDPDDVTINGNYATFLTDIKKDYNNAEKHYLKALASDPDDVTINGNYANFLKNIKKDYRSAEKHYLKALASDPDDADYNGNYAVFLKDIKKDYDNAEKHYLKALASEPDNANANGNYAGYLLCINRKEEATKYLDKAFKLNDINKIGLLVELWFYRYAHYPEWYGESEKELDRLLMEGLTSPGWDLESNVEAAIAAGHPNPKKLKEFASAITQ
jgi:protein O-mannosyl-transferase